MLILDDIVSTEVLELDDETLLLLPKPLAPFPAALATPGIRQIKDAARTARTEKTICPNL